MDNNNAKSLLLEHSEAKVTLYGTYLAIYLLTFPLCCFDQISCCFPREPHENT